MTHKAQRQPCEAGAGKAALLKQISANHTGNSMTNQRHRIMEALSPKGGAWTCNNLDGLRPEHIRNIVRAGKRIAAEHGLDPCTKAQAAAHEAGHLIVASAMGETVRGARIWQEASGLWVGMNKRESRSCDERWTVKGRPGFAFQQACNLFAGVVGEGLAGHFHPASSLDERGKVQLICAELDDLSGDPEGMAHIRATTLVQAILTHYRAQFNIVRLHLMQRRRLTPSEAKRMLAKVEAI
jgi:hypothetical protein